MKKKLLSGLVAFVCASASQAQIVINEIDPNTPSTDAAEFIEVYDGGVGNTALTGHALVFFNGSNGLVYDFYDLGALTTDSDGFVVIGNVDGAALSFSGATNQLQNGADAVAIYNGPTATAFLSETQTGATAIDLVDAIAYEGGGSAASFEDLMTNLGLTEAADESVGSDVETDSIQRNPDGANTFDVRTATPGATNFTLPSFELSFDPAQFGEEDGMFASFGSVIRGGDLTNPVNVTLTVTSGNGARVALSPTTVTIGGGSDFGGFDIDALSNNVMDGDAVVTIEASAPGFEAATASFVVRDDETPFPSLVINEILTDGFGGVGAEFVELYNSGTSTVTLDNYRVELYRTNPDFGFGELVNEITITSGSITPGGFFTIGSEFVSSVYGVTPDLEVAGLNFDNFEFTAVLVDSSDQVVFSALVFDPNNTVVPNRAGAVIPTDIQISDVVSGLEPSGYYLTTDGGQTPEVLEFVSLMSPAPSATPTRSNTTPQLTLVADLDTVQEDDTTGVTFTLTRFPSTSGDLTVTLSSSDLGELNVPATVDILDGDASAVFTGTPVDDGLVDGSQEVSVTVMASGLTASDAVTVLDSNAEGLNVCDIAFVAAVSDNPDFFAFVTLVDLPSGVQISFTDNGWLAAGGFRPGEGTLTWTGPNEGVAAGTIVSFTDNSPDIGVATAGGPVLSAAGDQLFAYQGEEASPSLIAGIQMNGEWDADATSTNTSALPAVLDPNGGLAISPEVDNAVYTGITTGTVAQLKAAVLDSANYTTGNSRDDVDPTALPAFFVIGEPSDYTVSIEGVSASSGTFVINFTASGPSDVYVTSDFSVWNLVANGDGVVGPTFTDTNPPAERAFYLIQEAGTPPPPPLL